MEGKPKFLNKNIGLIFVVAVVALFLTYAYLLFIRPSFNIARGGAESTSITSQDEWGESLTRQYVDLSTTPGSIKIEKEPAENTQSRSYLTSNVLGNPSVSWCDYRDEPYGDAHVFFQKLSNNGVKLFTEDIDIGDTGVKDYQYGHWYDSDDILYYAYPDYLSSYNSSAELQNTYNTPNFGGFGRCDGVSSSPLRFGVAPNGNIFFIEATGSPPNYTYEIFSYDNEGNLRFQTNPHVESDYYYNIFAPDNEYIYVFGSDKYAGDNENPTKFYISKVSSNGSLVWEYNYITSYYEYGDPENPEEDCQFGYNNLLQYSLNIDSDGDIWFPFSMGGPSCYCENDSRCAKVYEVASTGDSVKTNYDLGNMTDADSPFYFGFSYGFEQSGENMKFDSQDNGYLYYTDASAAHADSAKLRKYSASGIEQWETTVAQNVVPGTTTIWADSQVLIGEYNYLTYETMTDGNNIYLQKVRNSDGELMFDQPIRVNSDVESTYLASAYHTTSSTQIDGTEDLESWDDFEPTQTTPADTSVDYQFRTSDDAATWTAWSAAEEYDGANPIDLSGLDADRYLQVKATLATTDTSVTPQIDDYTINYTTPDDPCDDFDHIEISRTPSGPLQNGTIYSIVAHAYDTGGGTIDTDFTFSHPSNGSWNQVGGAGVLNWTTPNNLPADDYTVSVTSDCGGSASVTMTKHPDDNPDPIDICDRFSHINLSPTGGDYGAGSSVDISSQTIKNNGNPMQYGSVSYSVWSSDGQASIDGSGNLTMPTPGARAVVTATHPCGSKTALFTANDLNCDTLDRILIVPSSLKINTNGSYNFDTVAYRKNGSEFGPNQVGFNYSVNKGSVNSYGVYTAPSTGGKAKITVKDTGDCGTNSNANITVIQNDLEGKITLPDQTEGEIIYLDDCDVEGNEDRCVDLNPRLIIEGAGDVTNQVEFYYEALRSDISYFDDNSFCFSNSNAYKVPGNISTSYKGNYFTRQVSLFCAKRWINCSTPPCYSGLYIVKPEANKEATVGERIVIEWTNYGLDEYIDSISLEYSTDDGKNYTPIVSDYPNSGQYDWNIPNDNHYASDRAKIRLKAYDAEGNEIGDDDSERFVIKGKGGLLSIGDSTPQIKVQLAAEAPLAGLAFLGLLWPYLIGALDRRRFLADLSNLFNHRIQELQFLMGLRKRPRKWGTVYDYEDKLPLKLAKVMLFDKQTNKLKQTYISNRQGEFGFLVEPGDYYIQVQKAGYDWALKAKEAPATNQFEKEDKSTKEGKDKDIWRAGVSDGYYSNLYFGQVIPASEIDNSKKEDKRSKQKLQLSVPLEMKEKTFINVFMSFLRKIASFFYRFRLPILIAGSLLSIYLLITQKTILDIIVFVIYLIFWLIELIKVKEIRGYAKIVDQSKKGLGLAIIRVYDNEGRMIQTQITGADGKFILSCQPQKLVLKIRKAGYKPKKISFNLKSLEDISTLDVQLDKS